MKQLLDHINEHFEIVNEDKKGMFIVKTGTSYQTLWNTSATPSISYNDSSEVFTKLSDALKYAQKHLKPAKVKTSMGQGGIPGGFSTPIADVLSIDETMDHTKWTARYQATKDGATIIETTTNGKLADDANRLTAEFIDLSKLSTFTDIKPDAKDISRAESVFTVWNKGDDKAKNQLLAITDSKKFIRRLVAMLYTSAKRAIESGTYYHGYEYETGVSKWFDGMPLMTHSFGSMYSDYNRKHGTAIDFSTFRQIGVVAEETVKNMIASENIKIFGGKK